MCVVDVVRVGGVGGVVGGGGVAVALASFFPFSFSCPPLFAAWRALQVWGASFEASGARFATCSDDCSVVVWDHGVEGGSGLPSQRWRAACVLSGYHSRTVYVARPCSVHTCFHRRGEYILHMCGPA